MDLVGTGVPGLDEMLGGGLPAGRCVLVCGGPGSGKTTLCVQFLVEGARRRGEPGLFITLDESPVHVREDMSSYGWGLEGLEAEGKLAFIDATPIRAVPGQVKIGGISIGKRDFSMASLIHIIKSRAEETGARRMAVDPIAALIFQYADPSECRTAIADLFQAVADVGVTSLVTSELRASALEREIHAEEFLSHGAIILHTLTKAGSVVKALQVEKMRGVPHDHQLRPYRITKNGIEVYPKETVF